MQALKVITFILMICSLIVVAGFIPVVGQYDGPQTATIVSQETAPEANLPYLFAVYAVTWILFFVYLFYLSQRQKELKREIRELIERLPNEPNSRT